MNFDHTHYVPCLRWKLGEYQAVWRLPASTKEMFTPLIQIPEIGYDFKEKKLKKTIDEHLSDFVQKKIYKKWGESSCFVDLNLINPSERMASGIHPAKCVFDDLRRVGCSAVPVTGLDRDKAYQQKVESILNKDKNGVCLRVSIEHAARDSLRTKSSSLLSAFGVRTIDCDLILDLGAPNYRPLEGFSKVIQNIVSNLPNLNKWRTFTIIGASFPETMGGIQIGITNISRYEWQLYKILVNNFQKAGLRLPTFGDYAISHPKFSEYDMRLAKPSAKIRYTTNNNWYVVKGHNIRDKRFGKNRQYCNLSKRIIESRYYYGSEFSWGDEYIQKCANGGKLGSLTTWVTVDTNHHIEKVAQDIASFYASLSSS